MEVFKLVLSDTDSLLKNIRSSRQDNAKRIRESYKTLVDSRTVTFQKSQERIQNNIKRYLEDDLHNSVYSLQIEDRVNKYKEQLNKIDGEIEKVRAILQNGCGTIKVKERSTEPSVASASASPKSQAEIMSMMSSNKYFQQITLNVSNKNNTGPSVVQMAMQYQRNQCSFSTTVRNNHYPELSQFDSGRIVEINKDQIRRRRQAKETAARMIQRWWRAVMARRAGRKTTPAPTSTGNKKFAKREYC